MDRGAAIWGGGSVAAIALAVLGQPSAVVGANPGLGRDETCEAVR